MMKIIKILLLFILVLTLLLTGCSSQAGQITGDAVFDSGNTYPGANKAPNSGYQVKSGTGHEAFCY